MLKAETEEISVLFDFLSTESKKRKNDKVTNSRLGTKSLIYPFNLLIVETISTGLTFRIAATIYPQTKKIKDDNGQEKEISEAGQLEITTPIKIPGLRIVKTGDKEYTVRKNGFEKFVIYTCKEGYPTIISAGYSSIPSGPTIKIDTVEKLREDMDIFTAVIEKVINELYFSLYTKLSSEAENNWDGLSIKTDNPLTEIEKQISELQTVIDEEAIFTIRRLRIFL